MRRPWLCLILCVVVLVLVAPSLTVRAGPAEDSACRGLTADAGQGGVLTDDEYTVLTGCVRAENGTWFFPTGPDDNRLPGGPILSADEVTWVAGIAATIREQLDGLWAQFDSYWQGELQRIEEQATDGAGRLAPGYGPQDQGSIATVYNYYAPVADAYFRNPDVLELGSYVAWWLNRRLAAGPGPSGSQMYDQAARNYLQYDRLPWPWDLADPVNMASFLRWALDNGYIDSLPASTGVSAVTASGDCVETGEWAADGRERVAEVQRLAPSSVNPTTAVDDLSDAADAVLAVAAEQEAAAPGTVRARNALLVDAMLGVADTLDALADAYADGDAEGVRTSWGNLGQATADLRKAAAALDAEATRCGY